MTPSSHFQVHPFHAWQSHIQCNQTVHKSLRCAREVVTKNGGGGMTELIIKDGWMNGEINSEAKKRTNVGY